MSVNWETAATDLGAIFTRYVPLLIGRAVADAGADYGQPLRLQGDALHWAQKATDALADQVPGIVATQRDRIATLVNAGDRAALTAALEDLDYSRDRAALIADTTLNEAYNRGIAVAAWAADELSVDVNDGDWDAECAALNGTVQTREWAFAHPLGHPRCRRTFSIRNSSR